MPECSRSVLIDAPPDVVWSVMGDVTGWSSWTGSVSSAELLDPGPVRVGTRVRLHQPRLPPVVWTVQTHEPGAFTWTAKGLGVSSWGDHRVTPTAGGSRVDLTFAQTGPLARLTWRIYARLIRSYVDLEAEGLKRRAESLAGAAPEGPVGHDLPLAVYLDFLATVVSNLAEVAGRLGDERINERPDLAVANAPYAIIRHCCGVMEWWGGHVIAGRPVVRDREAEFTAVGSVADLQERLSAAHEQLKTDLETLVATDPPRAAEDAGGFGPSQPTQGHVALHIYEELSQHLGHLDLTADLLRAADR